MSEFNYPRALFVTLNPLFLEEILRKSVLPCKDAVVGMHFIVRLLKALIAFRLVLHPWGLNFFSQGSGYSL